MNKKIIKVTQDDESLMNLTWVINNICNNRCSYCLPDLNTGIGHHYTWENAEKFLNKLFERHSKIHCSVSGGEPSLSPFLPDLVKMFNDNGHSIGVTSNAFKPVEYWEEMSKRLYYICFSYHPEFPAKDFKEKVIAASRNTYVTIRVMMLPSMWDHCVEVFHSLRSIPTLLVEPVRILDWGGANRKAHVYTQDQLYWFENEQVIKSHQKTITHLMDKKDSIELSSTFHLDDGSSLAGNDANPLQFINFGMTNFEGYMCEIGLKSLFVHYDGRIQMGNCMVGGYIGEVQDFENIKWPSRPVVCTKTLCHCATDVLISKWAPNYFEYITESFTKKLI